MDEALATGDAEFQRKSHARIDELRQEAGTVFLVAHNLNEIEETCNRVIWLENGRDRPPGENVHGIIDPYLAATGGTQVEPRPGHREAGPHPGASEDLRTPRASTGLT